MKRLPQPPGRTPPLNRPNRVVAWQRELEQKNRTGGKAMSQSNNATYDAVGVGTGGGGFAAAVTARKLGLSVVMVEKDKVFGGTTARSGGALWIPDNRRSRKAGYQDSLDTARKYLREEIGNFYDSDRIEAYLAYGPKMAEFFEQETEVEFFAYGMPD